MKCSRPDCDCLYYCGVDAHKIIEVKPLSADEEAWLRDEESPESCRSEGREFDPNGWIVRLLATLDRDRSAIGSALLAIDQPSEVRFGFPQKYSEPEARAWIAAMDAAAKAITDALK